MAEITRVGVIGSGLMGSGIAEICAKAGVDVIVREINAAAAEAGLGRLTGSLERAVRNGKIDEATKSAALDRLTFTTELADLADRELIIEAAVEDEKLKVALFRDLDQIVTSPDAILATNTSSIPVTRIAAATNRPANVIGMHFFNPVPVHRLCELVVAARTSDDTVARVAEFASTRLGKTVIKSKDQAGFIVNALLVPYILSAIRMFGNGFASAEDIDAGMVNGCAHPMGPLRLADLVGLDTLLSVGDRMFEEFKEPLYAPPPILSRMVEAGMYGRKSGQGFYTY
jgi:3-hydroxybutyryl-CoA dehydrogenase